MAIYHLSMQIVSRGKGQNAVAMAAYRSGEKLLDEDSGEVKNYQRLTPPEAFILAPKHAPIWAYDREQLWNEVERVEKRVDSQLAREMNIALPRELTNEEQRILVEEFVTDTFVSQGMIADVAIHRDDLNNPHFHVMLTMRDVSESGFGLKNRSWNPQFANRGKSHSFNGRGFVKDSDSLVDVRGQWAIYANRALGLAGHVATRIDHRSYSKQGLDLVPTKHIGSSDHLMEKKALEESSMSGEKYRPVTKYGRINAGIQKLNRKIAKEIQQGEATIISLEKKIEERKSNIRYQLERSGTWDQLNDVEKTSVVFIQKRMKTTNVDLGVAIECRSSVERWGKVLNKTEAELKQEISQLKSARELYKQYQAGEDTVDQLAKLGFTTGDFKEEFKQRAMAAKQGKEKIEKQKGYIQEGLEKTNIAIKMLEDMTLDEAKVIYSHDAHARLSDYKPLEVHLLVNEYRRTGVIVPVDQIESFLKDRTESEKASPVPVLEQYQKLLKDNRFLVNWIRKLNRHEQELASIKVSDPKEFARGMSEITKERGVIVERMKKLKTTLSVVEKAMIEEIRKQYPGETWADSIEPKTAHQLLTLNEQEGRVVSPQEILDRTSNDSSSKDSSYQPMTITSDVLVNELSQGIRTLMSDTRHGKSELDRAAEEQKRRSERRGKGYGRGR
ncbi:hypothetical protein J2Z48_002925 [Croceifilum oryzae]|uniref:MobA/MobL protein domain-containing protein n=1 Tax=Croceifilum oryzae TaxID=1553429 RepID=A0AAJ1WV74_9BACL|nr:MobQ family relaxase [Croceifilum oryzae]MDQ0418721.1 hypothetical protein [Croceifilum oryzae]